MSRVQRRGLGRRCAALIVLLLSLLLLLQPTAGAQTPTVISTKMTVTDFDEAAAEAAGNEIVKQADGTRVLRSATTGEVRATLPPAGVEAQGVTQDTVVGECGTSSIYLDDDPAPALYNMTTGFVVNDPAISYGWFARVEGEGITDEYVNGGPLALERSWSRVAQDEVLSRGDFHTAEVIPSSSFAVLYWGGVCTSGGPSAAAVIY